MIRDESTDPSALNAYSARMGAFKTADGSAPKRKLLIGIIATIINIVVVRIKGFGHDGF